MNPFRILGWFFSGKQKGGMSSLLLTTALAVGGGYVGVKKTDAGASLFDQVLMTGMEKLGSSKKDILIKRVNNAQEVQEDAAEVFTSALDEFKAVSGFQGGELEAQYNKLKGAYDRSEKAANRVTTRIDQVIRASNRLITEWESELEQYSNPSMREKSATMLLKTRNQCQSFVEALGEAEDRIEPVLTALRDNTTFLKHNLNSQAIASLQDDVVIVQNDVEALLKEMRASIEEAKVFIETLEANPTGG